ncbi:hypothetical protein FPOA_11901 [Fusarium poae]|uniref:Uncharacterized protein n=1 Tax=Fusarium poae TaxID=36050 RepID=A0A1B8AHZ4_FUSPO|nr:hypothetical protein FPOA_11901 [Fusarium poae]
MAVSLAAEALCLSPSFLNNSLTIINLDRSVCENQASDATPPIVCHEFWFANISNITAIKPLNETNIDAWAYRSNIDLRVSKPLLVDCPMPVCAFATSGTYVSFQRYLLYLNLVLCIVASMAPVLRGIAQAYLAATGISAAAHFITIYKLKDHHIVDMDFFPALIYLSTGMIATLLWSLLRSTNKVKSYRDVMIFQAAPILFMNALLITVAVMLSNYKLAHLPVVLLDSEAAFRLTSICFQDSTGSAHLWTGTFKYPIRQPEELKYLLPSDESQAQSVSVFPVSIDSTRDGFLIVLLLLCTYMLILRLLASCGYNPATKTISLDFLRCAPRLLRKMFSPGLAPSGAPEDRLLILTPDFFILLFGISIDLVAYVVFVINLERGMLANDLPPGELPYQYSQWTPVPIALKRLTASNARNLHRRETWKHNIMHKQEKFRRETT